MSSLSLGANVAPDGAITFRVRAPAATRVEVLIYEAPTVAEPVAHLVMPGPVAGVFEATLAAPGDRAVYYGYRAWGPNWPHDPTWRPGSAAGFVADVDHDGNRFNPNKLLLDPYAREISHCVQTPARPERTPYRPGEANRTVDTGPFAPKGIVVAPEKVDLGAKPTHAFKDDIIYEVHLRGLTKADPDVPEALRGTYAGAALRASYLRDLGVTAVEFLPVQQTQNALNDDPGLARDHNYWGYETMGFFAPDRRHAADQSPGGPTREWKAMVAAFHAAGLKVFVDVVYNHHEEGGVDGSNILYSLRGLDNAGYYETRRGEARADLYQDDTGVGPNVNAATPIVRDLVLDSLRYWADEMGVDGFRFDLGAVLGNARADGGFAFDRDDPDNILNRAVRGLPARPAAGGAGVDLIAEPYTATFGGYEAGNFPTGWAEWNDRYRDTIRAAQNKLGFVPVTPAALARRVAGSDDLFAGRGPVASVNYVVCHDGFCLRDLHSYADRRNREPYPYGPSEGGRAAAEEMCWDHGGDRAAQDQAARTSLALLMLSAGVPMITGGTEMGRTQYGNNNAFNLDAAANWLDWHLLEENAALLVFTRNLLAFRRAHPALRPAEFFTGRPVEGSAIPDIAWLRPDGGEMDATYLDDAGNHFVAWQIDGAPAADPAARLYVAYNGWVAPIEAALPTLPPGLGWYLAIDTGASAASRANVRGAGEETPVGSRLVVGGRACAVAIAKPVARANGAS